MKERQIRETVREAATDMVVMQRKLHDAGLHATARLVNEASQKLGWEAEEVFNKINGVPQTPRSKDVTRG